MTASVLHLRPPPREPASPPEAASVLAAARSAAHLLARHAGLPVSVRPREDRRVAVATVASPELLQVAFGLYPEPPPRRWPLEILEDFRARRARWPDRFVLGAEAVASAAWLYDRREARLGPFGARHFSGGFRDLDAVAEWLDNHVLPAPVPLVSPAELAAWRAETVIDAAPGGGRKVVPLLRAALEVYGPTYGAEISAAELSRAHGLSAVDASRIAEVVLRVVEAEQSEVDVLSGGF